MGDSHPRKRGRPATVTASTSRVRVIPAALPAFRRGGAPWIPSASIPGPDAPPGRDSDAQLPAASNHGTRQKEGGGVLGRLH